MLERDGCINNLAHKGRKMQVFDALTADRCGKRLEDSGDPREVFHLAAGQKGEAGERGEGKRCDRGIEGLGGPEDDSPAPSSFCPSIV